MVLPILIILLFSILSFNSSIYWFLVHKTGVGMAYVLDQLLPFTIALVVSLFLIRKSKNKINLLRFLKSHCWSLGLLLIIAFFVHRWILGFYFYSEDPTTILSAITNNHGNRFLYGLLRGYPFGIFVASFLLFWTNTWFYNLVTILLYLFLVIAIYGLFYQLTEKKFASFLGTVFFITTPSYLDMFVWQSNSGGMFITLISGILSILFLLYYQKKKITGIYIVSILFFVAMVKMGFGRAAGFVALPIFLIFFPFDDSRFTLKKSFMLSIPYILTCVLFVLFVFLVPDGFFQNITSGHSSQITVRHVQILFEGYFSAFFTWITYLFLPNQFAGIIYPLLKQAIQHYPSFSLTVCIGIIFSIILFSITLVSLFYLNKKTARLILLSVIWIVCNISFVPLFLTDYHDTTRTDWYFTRIDPGSGPGSKYVFFSTVGVSMLITIFTFLLKRKSKNIFAAWTLFLFGVFCGFILFDTSYYKQVLRDTPQASMIPNNVFSMVPNDGKKKLLFSANPMKNAIDQSATYEDTWLNSFYPSKELLYINDRDTFEKLIREGKYNKENVYAFYNNPITLAFIDVSQQTRNELFNTDNSKNNLPISTNQVNIVSKIIPSGLNDNNYPWILERGVFISDDLNYRFVLPRKIRFSIKKNDDIQLQLPYLDAIITNVSNQRNPFPLQVWSYAKNQPLITDKDTITNLLKVSSFDNKLIYEINLQDRLNVVDILKERESVRLGTKVSVSDVYKYNTPEDKHVSKDSLTDGIITHDPLREYESYFIAKTTPTEITLDLPFETVLGRVLLNTPPRNLDNLPTDVEVYSLKDGRELVGSLLSQTPASTWSPNKGNLTDISLQPLKTNSLQIDIKKTTKSPIILDEITLDTPIALQYSPEQIYQLGILSFHYVDNKTLLEKLFIIKQFNMLTLFYACAEDNDWIMQKRNLSETVPNIWKVGEIPLSSQTPEDKLTMSVDCYGSVLRKLIVVGPPYPSTITMQGITLE